MKDGNGKFSPSLAVQLTQRSEHIYEKFRAKIRPSAFFSFYFTGINIYESRLTLHAKWMPAIYRKLSMLECVFLLSRWFPLYGYLISSVELTALKSIFQANITTTISCIYIRHGRRQHTRPWKLDKYWSNLYVYCVCWDKTWPRTPHYHIYRNGLGCGPIVWCCCCYKQQKQLKLHHIRPNVVLIMLTAQNVAFSEMTNLNRQNNLHIMCWHN